MPPMENNGSSPGVAAPDSGMDLDFMDNLLLDGCWLETMNGSDFLQNSPPSFSALFDSSFSLLPDNPESGIGNSVPPPSQRSCVAEDEVPRNLGEDFGSDKLANDGGEVRRRWWIRPRASPGPSTPVMDRLIRALAFIQDFAKDKDVLIQLWVPVNRGDKRVLTTNKQPFYLDPGSGKLLRYREISVNYQFSAEEDSKELVGLPSRVFFGKVPEWSPDVRFFKSEEYPRLDHAQQLDVRGTLAVPVFEQGSRTCLGVIEVVMMTQKVKYRPEIETVRKALEAVDLRSSGSCGSPSSESILTSYDAVLPEIQEILISACEAHGLPLAQTWASCNQQGREGCRHSEETYVRCVSTIDRACHIADTRVLGFHEACSEYHLLKGQGVAGQAFLTNWPCFLSDITSISKMEYPLSHHAALFGLRTAVAIRLRCVYEGSPDFVLEFFLPSECKDPVEQKRLLASLSVIIQRTCKSLRVISDKELEDEVFAADRKSNGEHLAARVEKEDISGEESLDCCRPPDLAAELGGDGSSLLGEASCSKAATAKKANRKRSKAEKSVTLDALRQYFAGSLKDAAKGLGVCPTTLKRICRQHGIKRWPSRKIKKVDHSLHKLQHVINSVQGTPSSLQIGSFYKEFPDLASPDKVTTRSSNAKPNDPNKSSRSPSLSCSHGSNSSHRCSSGERQNPSTADANDSDDGDDGDRAQIRRLRSHGELNGSAKEVEEAAKLMPRSESHKSFDVDAESLLPSPERPMQNVPGEGQGQPVRIKASYAGDKVRFRLQPNWGLSELWRELAGRFNIEDVGKFDLKYLDDDSEWVLLMCDADLAECMDLCRSSRWDTVKLSVEASHQGRRAVSSWGSSSGGGSFL